MGGIVGRLFREFAVTLSVAIAVSLRRLAHHHADDVRALPAARSDGASAGASTGSASARSAGSLAALRAEPRAGSCATSSLTLARHPRCTDRAERLPLRHRAQGLLPPAGRRAGSSAASRPTRTSPSRPCARRWASSRTSCRPIPAVEHRGRLHGRRRQPDEHRAHVRRAQAARRAQRLAPTRSSTACAASSRASPAPRCSCRPCRTCASAAARAMRSTSTRCRARTSAELNRFAAAHARPSCASSPQLRDVATDQQNRGLQAALVIDRDTASRLGILPQAIDETLYDAFGQRQVSTIYTPLNQYHVVLEVAPRVPAEPGRAQERLRASRPRGAQVPLDAFTRFAPRTTPLAVNHQGQFPAVTLSFNLAPGVALGDAVDGHPGGRARDRAARRRSAAASRAPRRPSRPRSPTSRS